MRSSEEKSSSPWREAVAAFAAVALLNAVAALATPSIFPDPSRMRVVPQDAARTGALLSLGMRRLAADISFIDLLVYYGEWELGISEQENENGRGRFFEFKDRTLRILDLDPYFTYVALYSAGSLAFNLDRPQEALEVLDYAARFMPKEWKLRAYSAAIALKMKGDAEGVRRELMPVLQEPDCPTQLKSMLAFLNRRLGHREEAIRIYQDILISRDPSYVGIARKALEEMEHPKR